MKTVGKENRSSYYASPTSDLGWSGSMHKELELRRNDFRIEKCLTEEEIFRLKALSSFTTYMDHEKNNLILKLHAEIYGRDHPTKHIVSYPSNWWQAVKERFAPHWFLKRYPVKFTTVEATLRELFPDVAPPPGHHSVIKLLVKEKKA